MYVIFMFVGKLKSQPCAQYKLIVWYKQKRRSQFTQCTIQDWGYCERNSIHNSSKHCI